MQYMENLTDRQAAEAVRARLDWKYALGLRLDDAGFDDSVLSEFRQRLLRGAKEGLLLERILQVAEEGQFLEGKSTQRTDATYVLARIRRSRHPIPVRRLRRCSGLISPTESILRAPQLGFGQK